MTPVSPPPPPPAASPPPAPSRGGPAKPGKGATSPAPAPVRTPPVTAASKDIEAGRALLAKGDAPGAQAAFNRALSTDPANPEALDGRGYALMLQNDDAGAQRDIIRALELRNFAEARYHLGLLYKKNGVLSPALTQFENAITLDSKLAKAYVAKGQTLELMTRLTEAIPIYDAAVSLDPSNGQALEARGRAYFQTRQFQQARTDFQRAIQIDPFSIDLLYARGRTELALGQFDDAVATFEELVLRRPDFATQCSRGMAYLERGDFIRDKKDKSDFRKAYDAFTAALVFKPDDTDTRNRAGYASTRVGTGIAGLVGTAGKLAYSSGGSKPSLATLDPNRACGN